MKQISKIFRFTIVLLVVAFIVPTCESVSTGNESETINTIFQEADTPLSTPTYDGSGQLTHPCVLYFPQKWNGYNFWAVATPYPYENDKYENPSIYCFDSAGDDWEIPKKGINPIISEPLNGFNSDPCIVYNNESNELYLYYRDFNHQTQTTSYLITNSSDGINWSEPYMIYNIKGNKPTSSIKSSFISRLYVKLYLYIDKLLHPNAMIGSTNVERSNSIIKLPNGTFMMWAQLWDAPYYTIYRTSTDGIHWSDQNYCVFYNTTDNENLWHIEVKYIPEHNEYLMLQYYYDYKQLKLAKSVNAIEWECCSYTILDHSENESNFANAHLYKSSITYDQYSDTVHLWYTGVNNENEWRIGYTNTSYTDLTL